MIRRALVLAVALAGIGAGSAAAGPPSALNGRWVLDPDWWDRDMADAAGLGWPVTRAAACTVDGWFSFTIDGTTYRPGNGAPPLDLEPDGDRWVPVPPEGRPIDSEAHGFALVDPDTLESLTEGDTALWRRCPG